MLVLPKNLHLRNSDLLLSEAIVNTSRMPLEQGYMRRSYICEETSIGQECIEIAASKEVLLHLFWELVHELGSQVGIVLRTSHEHGDKSHDDYFVENMDISVLSSILGSSTGEDFFESSSFDIPYIDLLLKDGRTGIAITNEGKEAQFKNEIQLDGHKIITIYGEALDRFEKVLKSFDICKKRDMLFIDQVSHRHSTSEEYKNSFSILADRLGAYGEGFLL